MGVSMPHLYLCRRELVVGKEDAVGEEGAEGDQHHGRVDEPVVHRGEVLDAPNAG